MTKIKRNKGFTLIELLVVIAIIGILSSIVVASLNTARKKSRDTRRVADIKQIQMALEMYFDQNREYPYGNEGTASPGYKALAPTFIATIPAGPSSGEVYQYQALETSSGVDCDADADTCLYYHLGVILEENNPTLLGSDRDLDITASGDTIDGTGDTANCGDDDDGGADMCYDVTP